MHVKHITNVYSFKKRKRTEATVPQKDKGTLPHNRSAKRKEKRKG